ncbi:MAG: TetR family transcriptional regulator [Alphaproteobacteria bacterium]|jgi:AcrR family transcriptional regulator|nr:TetR family transcriptional regulator [Alphaproteobacteria bacterium]MBT6384720.1 TetR family transcriptional regulator [Alphaproteobacteria bacterium]
MMVENTGKTKSKKKPAKAVPADPLDQVLDAMLKLAEQLGWRDLTLRDIADEAGLSLAQLQRLVPGKSALLSHFVRRVDQVVLDNDTTADPDEPVKDRLFDVAMQRFDALQPWRGAIKAIARDLPYDPVAAICLGARRRQSMIWMLEKAGVSSSGLKGRLRAAGLDVIIIATMRVWLKDESKDMSATMSALDRHLSRTDRLVSSLQGQRSFRQEDQQTAAG